MDFEIKELTLPLLKEKIESFIDSLQALKTDKNVSKEKMYEIFEKSKNNSKTFVIIEKSSGNIIGSVRWVIDYKFIRGGVIGGRVEEVVLHPEYQGKWLGSKLMAHVLEYLKQKGCYKIELACREELIPFNRKFWFEVSETEMKLYT